MSNGGIDLYPCPGVGDLTFEQRCQRLALQVSRSPSTSNNITVWLASRPNMRDFIVQDIFGLLEANSRSKDYISWKDIITVPYNRHQYEGSTRLWREHEEFVREELIKQITSSQCPVVPLLLEAPDDFETFLKKFVRTQLESSMRTQARSHWVDQSWFDTMDKGFAYFLSERQRTLLIITHIPEKEEEKASVYWQIGSSQFHDAKGFPFCFPDTRSNQEYYQWKCTQAVQQKQAMDRRNN